MLITDTYKRFVNTLIDKYGDASIEDFEFTELFNRAAPAVLADQFNNKNKRGEKGVLQYAFEMSQTDLHKWQSLVQSVTLDTDATGKVTIQAIEALLSGSQKLFHVNTPLVKSEQNTTYREAHYTRHNDYARIIANTFMKPTDKKPVWLGFDGYIQVFPEQTYTTKLTVTRLPKSVKLDFVTPTDNVDSDLSEMAIQDVLIRMEQYYAIQIRETQLYETTSNQETKQ